MKKDQNTFLPLCFIVVNLLAYWLFRSIKANVFNLIMIVITLIWAMGALAMGNGTINIITMIMPASAASLPVRLRVARA